MPPAAKKQKKQPAALSPKEDYCARLEKALDDNHCKGSMLIMGMKRDDGDDEDEDDTVEYTAEQISTLRHILINDSRGKALDAGRSFASCGQSDDDCPISMFDTSTGNRVIDGIPGEVKKALKKSTPARRFDVLFGLTHGLKTFDTWMHDNECWEPGGELEKAMKTLAKAWRGLLKKSDAELGIDTAFTRPGIESLLEQLKDDFEGCEATEEFEFKWRA